MVIRHARLNENLSALRSTLGTPRDLTEQLKTALRRPKVRQVDADVRVHDADQSHVGEVESLRDHLRAEQDVDVAVRNAVEYVGVCPLPGGGVDVHSYDP